MLKTMDGLPAMGNAKKQQQIAARASVAINLHSLNNYQVRAWYLP